MIIYHGGTDIVKTPRIIQTYTGRDFGVGFYTTSIREQAVKWAIRQARYRKKDVAVLNTYFLDVTVQIAPRIGRYLCSYHAADRRRASA